MNRLNAERRQARQAAWTGTKSWFLIAASAVALWRWKTVEAHIGGQAVGVLLALILFSWFWRPAYAADNSAPSEDYASIRKKVLAYGFPFVPLALLSWASSLGDRYVLGGLLGLAAVGQYAAASAIANQPFGMLAGVFSQVLRPSLFEAESKGETKKSERLFILWISLTAGIGLAGVVLFWLLGPWVCGLLLAANYREGSTAVIVWIALSSALVLVTQIFENRLLSFNQSQRLIWPSVTGAASALLFNFLLIPYFGLAGAAQARTVSSGIQFAATWWVLSRARRAGTIAAVPGAAA